MSKSEINHINSWEVNIEDATPVMQQYLQIKKENPDILLWYRLGDFYETFFEDALIMSKELELTLTGRDCGPKIGRIPLAGIPAKAGDNYLEKLYELGFDSLRNGGKEADLGLALGAGEVTLKELVYAFSVFARDGKDYTGNQIYLKKFLFIFIEV